MMLVAGFLLFSLLLPGLQGRGIGRTTYIEDSPDDSEEEAYYRNAAVYPSRRMLLRNRNPFLWYIREEQDLEDDIEEDSLVLKNDFYASRPREGHYMAPVLRGKRRYTPWADLGRAEQQLFNEAEERYHTLDLAAPAKRRIHMFPTEDEEKMIEKRRMHSMFAKVGDDINSVEKRRTRYNPAAAWALDSTNGGNPTATAAVQKSSDNTISSFRSPHRSPK